MTYRKNKLDANQDMGERIGSREQVGVAQLKRYISGLRFKRPV